MTAARSGPTCRVMISSTARDLPDHRKALMDVCARLSLLPRMMEHLPASDDDAIAASLALVNEADIYLGVFASATATSPEDKNARSPRWSTSAPSSAASRGSAS